MARIYKYYEKDKLELEQGIEALLVRDSTVTEAVLKLRGIMKISLMEGYEVMSGLEPHQELKDGIAYVKTERYKNENIIFPCFERPFDAMIVSRQYILHRNGEGMVYVLENPELEMPPIDWCESTECPKTVLERDSRMRLKK